MENFDIVGKFFNTNYGDVLFVVEKTKEKRGTNYLYRCQFQKYPCEVLKRKCEILNGSSINPLQDENEFIGKEFKQKCGDSIKVLEKTLNKDNHGCFLYRCIFQKYPYETFLTKQKILSGQTLNPLIEEEEFVSKLWSQNCGDTLRIIKKTNIKRGKSTSYLFECEFIKYPCRIQVDKRRIKLGTVLNPRIEEEEFISKIWPQNCGDSLRVLKKTKEKYHNGFLWECEFIKYPYKIIRRKEEIIKGSILNPRIEEEEFVNKIWFQNCGDSLKVEKEIKIISNTKFYRYTFLKYPYSNYAKKEQIVAREVDNPKLPYKNKKGILNILKLKFQDKKPTLYELSKELNISSVYTGQQIRKFHLEDYINYFPSFSQEEKDVLNYLKSFYNLKIINSDHSILKDKEIDIYLPDLKIGFEFNGDYWHSNEMIRKRMNKSAEEYHQEKYNLAKEKGIDLYFIWEHDWKGRQEVVKRYLRILISKYKNINRN